MKISDRRRMAVGLAGLLAVAAGSGPAAVFDGLFDSGRVTESFEKLAESETLGPEENFKVVELGRNEGTSHHIVWIRERERPHRHDRHDLVAVIVRGHGRMLLGEDEREVGEGSILFVPRGTVHAFRNLSGETAVAYAVYTPAFDGKDRVEVEERPR